MLWLFNSKLLSRDSYNYANEILKGDLSNESYRQVVLNCIVKLNPFICG